MNTNTATTSERIEAARETGRLTFFEIADQDSVHGATNLMNRVVQMTPLLDEDDVQEWRREYEKQEMQAISERDAARKADD